MKRKNKEQSELAGLLFYATMDEQKTFDILQRCIKEKKVLFAHYPMFDKTDVSKMELIGPILDGTLYLKDKDRTLKPYALNKDNSWYLKK